MNIIFQIDGGIGKCIMATAVIEALRKKYKRDQLIIISGYPEVFLNNPNVDNSYGYGQLIYFYRDYVENQEVLCLLHDPYRSNAYIKQEEHLIKTWCEMFGLLYSGERPRLYFTQRETDFFRQKFGSNKPIFVLQSSGGAAGQPVKYSWARDLPAHICLKVIEDYKRSHTIVHLRREDQPGYADTVPVTADFREICTLLAMSDKRLLIDSFAQHACAALGLPSVVCWIANKPSVFGYDLHSNVLANPFTKKPELRGSFLQPFNITGDPVEFPYNNEQEIFDIDKIFQALTPDDNRKGRKPIEKPEHDEIKPVEKKEPALKVEKDKPKKEKPKAGGANGS